MTPILYRVAKASDAGGISSVLAALVAAGKRTKPSGESFALSHYIQAPHRIRCTVAVGPDREVLGFQSLKHATPGNSYGVAVDWGIIGTHIKPTSARCGVGRELFRHSLTAAKQAGLLAIDATIGVNNCEGLAYYEAIGFREYRRMDGSICKAYRLCN